LLDTLDRYIELLNCLKSSGALLNSIKPEFLLSFAEFRQQILPKSNVIFDLSPSLKQGDPVTAASHADQAFSSLTEEHKLYYETIERYFNVISGEAWCTLTFQIIKVYLLHRIFNRVPKQPLQSLTDSTSTSGSSASACDPALGDVESYLLKWASSHESFQRGFPVQLRNFGTDFADGTVIANIVLSHFDHWEAKKEDIYHCLSKLHLSCQTPDEFSHNAVIVNTLLRTLFGIEKGHGEVWSSKSSRPFQNQDALFAYPFSQPGIV
jgi:hypothetical protein